MAGLDASGFTPLTLTQIRTELTAAFQTVFGPTFAADDPDSTAGELVGILADREASLWQLAQDLYDAVFPDGASGVTLDRLCALTGVLRRAATFSRVTVTMTGTSGTVVPAGTRFSDPATGFVVALMSPATLTGGTASGLCQAVVAGLQRYPAGGVTHIATPVSGLTAVVNALDESVLGTDVESDAALRIRRQSLMHALGGGSLDSIRAGLLATTGVTEALVFENVTDAPDSSGIPAHSIEAVVLGGDDSAVATTLLARRAAGIGTHGSTSTAVPDSVGVDHAVSFSRPTDLVVYVSVTALYQGVPPADLATQIKARLVAYGDSHYHIAAPVRQAPLESVVLAAPTVVDVSTLTFGTSPGPSGTTTLYPTNRQRAVLDTSRIVVTLVRA